METKKLMHIWDTAISHAAAVQENSAVESGATVFQDHDLVGWVWDLIV